MDDKYRVYKESEIEVLQEKFRLNPHFDEFLHSMDKARVDDAVVIRTHDVMASQCLWAYAHQLQFAIEIGDFNRAIGTTKEDLENVRDYIADRAAEAESNLRHHRVKFPD
jgi:hypothetical protein